MDKYVRAARKRKEPWDRLRQQRVMEEIMRRVESEEPSDASSSRRPWRRVLLTAVAASLLLAGLAVAVISMRSGARDGANEWTRQSEPALSHGSLPDRSGTSIIRFSDGSEAVVYPGGRVLVREQRAGVVLLAQLSGAALFRVTKRPRRRFEVLAEGLTIRVVGTRFKVTVLAAHRVRVEVEEGLVEVSYGGQSLHLGAGDSLSLSRDTLASALGSPGASRPFPAPDAASRTPTPTPAPHERARARRRHAPGAAAMRPPATTGTPSEKSAPPPAEAQPTQEERDWIAATMKRVDAARRSARYAEAARLIRGLIARYPRNWRVSTATFTLARIEHSRRRFGAAARAYALYLRRAPRGPLAEDALAGEARALRSAGRRGSARKLARAYLKKYPHGTHARAMRSIMRE